MPKAMRTCTCGKVVHVRKNPCDCGHVFPKKGAVVMAEAINAAPKQAQVKVAKSTQTPVPDSSSANVGYTPAQADRIKELQNHINDLEKTMEKREKVWEARLQAQETKLAKFFSHQAHLITERAYVKFGGKGQLYYSKEFGDDRKMFKEQSDETGIFIFPALPDRSSEFPDGNSDEAIQRAAEVVVANREPVERDLKGDGVIIDDVMSFSYAVPVEVEKEVEAPTVANAVNHVKFLIGEAQ